MKIIEKEQVISTLTFDALINALNTSFAGNFLMP